MPSPNTAPKRMIKSTLETVFTRLPPCVKYCTKNLLKKYKKSLEKAPHALTLLPFKEYL